MEARILTGAVFKGPICFEGSAQGVSCFWQKKCKTLIQQNELNIYVKSFIEQMIKYVSQFCPRALCHTHRSLGGSVALIRNRAGLPPWWRVFSESLVANNSHRWCRAGSWAPAPFFKTPSTRNSAEPSIQALNMKWRQHQSYCYSNWRSPPLTKFIVVGRLRVGCRRDRCCWRSAEFATGDRRRWRRAFVYGDRWRRSDDFGSCIILFHTTIYYRDVALIVLLRCVVNISCWWLTVAVYV